MTAAENPECVAHFFTGPRVTDRCNICGERERDAIHHAGEEWLRLSGPQPKDVTEIDPEAVHGWFELTYANYLVIPRSHLQSMPAVWQTRFVELLREWESTAQDNGWSSAARYRVQAVSADGRFTRDSAPHYERGRTRLPIARPPHSESDPGRG